MLKQWPDIGGWMMGKGRVVRSLLWLLNLSLLLAIGLLWRNPLHELPAGAATDGRTPPLQLPASPLRTLSLEQYEEMLRRPIFWSGRRGLEVATANEAAIPSQPLGFVLTGVVISPQSKYALLSKAGTTKVTKVQPGDIVEGWVLESLTAESASLTRGSESRLLTLDKEHSTGS